MTSIKHITLSLVALSTLAFAGVQEHWDYAEHGPEHWGHFSETCAKGKEQSPINIVSEDTIQLDNSYSIELHDDHDSMSNIIDNGHSVKVTPVDGGYVKLHGKEYKLNQFHFHGASEHTVDGRRYNAVAHFVHLAKDGTVAVVAVFFEVGEKNAALQTILDNAGKSTKINPKDLMPADVNHYYHYEGSFTTPPCTEQVQWYVLKDTVSISKEQLKELRKYYDNNERPIQALNGRKIEAK
jgi:carbonic anhydrase